MGGGWLGRENQNSLVWPLSRVMLCAELGIALAPAQGGGKLSETLLSVHLQRVAGQI